MTQIAKESRYQVVGPFRVTYADFDAPSTPPIVQSGLKAAADVEFSIQALDSSVNQIVFAATTSDASLSVSFGAGNIYTITLETDGSGNIVSTAQEIVDAFNLDAQAVLNSDVASVRAGSSGGNVFAGGTTLVQEYALTVPTFWTRMRVPGLTLPAGATVTFIDSICTDLWENGTDTAMAMHACLSGNTLAEQIAAGWAPIIELRRDTNNQIPSLPADAYPWQHLMSVGTRGLGVRTVNACGLDLLLQMQSDLAPSGGESLIWVEYYI